MRRARRAATSSQAPPTVPDLVDAPELAAISLLEHALAVVRDALLAEHLTLIDDFHRPSEQGRVLALAFAICRREAALRELLGRYRHAVREAAAPAARRPSDDDVF